MATVYGYGRQSDPDPDSEDSPEIQALQTRRYYDGNLAHEGYEWGGHFTDLGVSGGKQFACRPQAAILMRRLERGDVVIFAKLDRGFRDTLDLLQTHRIWQQAGVAMVLLDLHIDTSTPIGEMMLTFGAAIATFERRRIGERMKEFRKHRLAQGRPCGRAPYGFKIVGPKGDRRYEPNPEQRKQGKLMLAWRQKDVAWGEIYLTLARQGIRQANGDEFSVGTIMNYVRWESALLATEEERRRQAERPEGNDCQAGDGQ